MSSFSGNMTSKQVPEELAEQEERVQNIPARGQSLEEGPDRKTNLRNCRKGRCGRQKCQSRAGRWQVWEPYSELRWLGFIPGTIGSP